MKVWDVNSYGGLDARPSLGGRPEEAREALSGSPGDPLGEAPPGEETPAENGPRRVNADPDRAGEIGRVGVSLDKLSKCAPNAGPLLSEEHHATLRTGAEHVGHAPASPSHLERSCSTGMPARPGDLHGRRHAGRPFRRLPIP
jgi:hypothetical protein